MVKTIKIQDDTHAELKKLGSIGNTFDDVIRMLIREYHQSVYVKMAPSQSPHPMTGAPYTYTFWCSKCGSTPVKGPIRICPKCDNKKTIGLTVTG